MRRSSCQWWVLGLVLFVAAQLLYARCWFYGFTNLDDRDASGQEIRALAHEHPVRDAFTRPYVVGVNRTYYRPVVNASFLLDAWVGGAEPLGYHVTNTLLHGCACVLLFALLARLGTGKWPSFLAGLLFVVYPLHVASVAWVPGRNDSLLGCFALTSLLLLRECAFTGSPLVTVAHCAAFFAALLTKESAVVLPAAFAIVLFSTKSAVAAPRRWIIVGSWLVLLVAYFVARGLAIKTEPGYYKGLLQVAWQYRNVFVADLGKVVLPLRLQVLATRDGILLLPGVIVIALLLAAIGLSIRIPQRASVWLALSLVVLPIAIGVLASDFVLLENRLYLASAGLCIGVGQWLSYARKVGGKWWHYSASLVGAAIAMHSVRTVHYSEQFRDSRTYAQAAIKAAPGNYLAMRLHMAASITAGGGKKPHAKK